MAELNKICEKRFIAHQSLLWMSFNSILCCCLLFFSIEFTNGIAGLEILAGIPWIWFNIRWERISCFRKEIRVWDHKISMAGIDHPFTFGFISYFLKVLIPDNLLSLISSTSYYVYRCTLRSFLTIPFCACIAIPNLFNLPIIYFRVLLILGSLKSMITNN